MTYDELMKEFEDVNAKMMAIKKEMSTKAQSYLEEAAKLLLEKHQILHCVFWTQYTPYFNDGESCDFGVNDVFFITQKDYDEKDYCGYEGSYIPGAWDLKCAKEKVEQAEVFQKDPEVFVEKFKEDWRNRYNRDPWFDPMERVPDLEKSKQEYEEAAAQVEQYGDLETLDAMIYDVNAFGRMVSNVPEDVMEMIYGDHAKVIITRNRTYVEECSHD